VRTEGRQAGRRLNVEGIFNRGRSVVWRTATTCRACRLLSTISAQPACGSALVCLSGRVAGGATGIWRRQVSPLAATTAVKRRIT